MKYKIINAESLAIVGEYQSDFIMDSAQYWDGTLAPPVCVHLEVPEGLDADVVKAEMVDEVITLVEDPSLVTAKATATKAALVQAAYARMDADIYASTATYFGTTNTDAQVATHETYKAMQSHPELFSGLGLLCDREGGGLHIGNPLNSVEAVTLYANTRLAEIAQLSIYRIQRIGQFRAERDAILNG